MEAIIILQLGAESQQDSIYYYSKNFIVWTTYDSKTKKHKTEYKRIEIPSYLHLPFLRCLRMFYAKSIFTGGNSIYFLLTLILMQLIFTVYDHKVFAFLLPFLIHFGFIALYQILNLVIKFIYKSEKFFNPNQQPEENPIEETMRNHGAEHLISEKVWFQKETIYSLGCSNSHMIIWFLVNLVLIPFMSITEAYLLSMFISGEIGFWLVFNQESRLAKLLSPLIKLSQYFTLLKPKEHNLKTAQLTLDKLIELERETNEER